MTVVRPGAGVDAGDGDQPGAEPGAEGAGDRLLQVVALAANEALTVQEAVGSCLDSVCTALGLPVGHFYSVDPEGARLVPEPVWFLADAARFDAFRRVTEALRLGVGEGLPGLAAASGRPEWIDDLANDAAFRRSYWAVESGLRAGLASPVLVGREVVGVLEFFAFAPVPATPDLADLLVRIGTQLGRVVERARLVGALRDSEDRMRKVIETAGDAFVGMDGAGFVTDWNAAAERVFGWSGDEVIGRRLSDTIIPARHRAAHDRALAHFLATGEGTVLGRRVELEALHRLGGEFPVELSVWAVRRGRTVAFNAFIHDITERRAAEVAVREAKERFQTAFDDAPIGMVLIDPAGALVQANLAYCEMLGYSQEAVQGMTLADVTHPDDLAPTTELIQRALAGGLRTFRSEQRYLRADGSALWVLANVSAVLHPEGDVAYFIGQVQDVSDRREAQDRLTRQALHDPLTGLPNRSLLLDRLHQALARAERHAGVLAVMFVDLDHFKLVNDSLGHAAGDEVLVAVAERMRNAVRASDTVCRLGGDEFVVLCEGLADSDEARVVAARLEGAANQPCRVGGEAVTVTASVGVAVAGSRPTSPEALIREADTAMYRAKARGKARHELYDDALHRLAEERSRMEAALRRAFQAGELELHYQPLVRLSDRTVVGVEALLRYDDPHLGPVVAGDFLEVAEEAGLMIPIGTWVLQQACRDAAELRARGLAVPVTVNLTPRQLARADLAPTVVAALSAAGLEPGALCLDVAEATFMVAAGSTLKALAALRDQGVAVAVDDFGTGSASLTLLRRLPADFLKVDRSLVAGLGADASRGALVEALVGMGAALGLTTVAEGVETAAQLDHLAAAGCALGQGIHLWAPCPLGSLVATLAGSPEAPGGG